MRLNNTITSWLCGHSRRILVYFIGSNALTAVEWIVWWLSETSDLRDEGGGGLV